MKQSLAKLKPDPYTIKVIAAIVLVILVGAALIIADHRARQPQVFRGNPENFTLALEDLEEGFKITYSRNHPFKTADGWNKKFDKNENGVRISIGNTVYVYPSIGEAESGYRSYRDSVLNLERLEETPFERFGDESFFYEKMVLVGETTVPYFELLFKKTNVVVYLELFIEDPKFDDKEWAYQKMEEYGRIIEEKIAG